MAEDKAQVISVFSQMSLFKGLDMDTIATLAAEAENVYLKDGETLFTQGEFGTCFYIIISGKLRVTCKEGRAVKELAVLSECDYTGEEALLYGRTHNTTVTALTPTRLVCFNRLKFRSMSSALPDIRLFLAATVQTRKLVRQKRFDWLNEGESIYLLARRHIAYLFIYLVPPVILAWLSVPVFLFAAGQEFQSVSSLAIWIGAVVLGVGVLWGIWRFVDWANDYYIVTNQRVVWVEKVILLYDSREEAPMSTILTVGAASDYIGRVLGYGDVVVRTYTGEIVLEKVGFPEQLAGLIEEMVRRTKKLAKKDEVAALERVIRKRLGRPDEEEVVSVREPKILTRPQKIKKRPSRRLLLKNFFSVRIVENGNITFRKHWLLLLQRIWLPTLLLIGLFYILIARLLEVYVFLSTTSVALFSLTFMFVVSLWWVYEYLDWGNDLYIVTETQIIDVYKRPLGKEEKRTAQLENILSLEHHRRGIIGILFNFGDVYAMIGAVKFTFDGVYAPADVQRDIFLKMKERKRQIQEAETAAERERIADWLEAYHNQVQDMNDQDDGDWRFT